MTARKLALALRHVHFEDCGSLGAVLTSRGFDIHYIEVGRDDLSSNDVVQADLVVGLGGPVGVYDTQHYPWITDELHSLELRVREGKPTLGICLGAQMLAHVLGARVYAGPLKELGWKPLRLTEEGHRSVISALAPELTSMLHWHGDTFDLPAGATLLASTQGVPNQVYEWGGCVLAFQCHPEVRPDDIESWLIGHTCEIGATQGVSVRQLRDDTARFGPTLVGQAQRVFSAWLAAQGL
jgi:GMP synthase (glutamine-hydrolysing)